MGKKRTFLYEGTPVDVDDSAVNDFLSKFPKAEPMESFVLGNDTVDVPASDISVVEKFKQQYPDAKPLFGEEQPQEIPAITLDSTEVAEGTANAPKPPTGPLKPGGGFTIGEVPKLTKQTKDIFVKNFLELPDNLKLDARNSGVFVNTFAKKMNLSPRELRQVANETMKTEMALKQLKTIYDQNPDDTDTLYKLAELHNNLGQHDLAYEAYAALEGKLKTIGEKEASDPNNPNKRPDYVEQRQLPAVAGMAYTQELLGNKAEAQRLKGISESKGYKGQEFSSVGAGEALQPGNDMVYNDQGQMVPVGSPTPESEYLNGIAQAIENFTLFGPANEMTNVGFDKLAKNLPGAFDPYGLPSDKIAKTVGVITGAVETLMGVAGMTTPAGALFAMPLVEVQNVAPEVAKWMMPLGVVLREYYRQQGEKMPEMMENVTVLADLGMLGWLTHQGVEGAKGLKAEIDLKKVFENLPPEAVEQLAKVGEKRIEMAQGDPKVYGEQMALRLDKLKPQVEEIKMQAEAAKPVEPYNPPPHPESLRTVEEGSSIIMNGEEGILERSDDGSWNFTTDKKSTQIPVADKFNPTETLKELGIEVLAEITPEQVARATADAEQVGRVEMNGKEYFVSLDRVGNENPTGDFVLEVKPDGTMINRFDSHPDPTFAKERKLKVINTFLESKGLPKRDKLTSTKLVEETPTQEQPSTLEIKPIENEKANQEGREKGLLDTPPLEQPLAPVAEKPTPNEPVSPAVEVQPIRQLGTGANVYFETEKYRVNDSQKGKVLLNVGDAKGETPLANIEFNTPEEAVFVAKKLQENAPDGLISDYHNVDKIIENYKEEYKQSLKEDVPANEPETVKVIELKPQLEVTPESIEIEAPDVESEFRKEPSEGNIGNDVDVRFADNVTIGAKYKLIEADDLQASHYTSGARNEKHGISQAQPKERNDLGSKAQQDKIAANPKFELVSEDNAAYSGAPIVNSRGEVIQGNNRSIGLKKHYQGGGTKYKGDLAANAEKYGFTKEQVEGMKNPVLVREITAQDNMAVRLGQFKATDLETGGKTRIDPITTSRKMSSQERGVLARLLVEGDYNSIKDAIRDNQKEIMKVLKKHLSPSEIKSMLKPGEDSFSATGMDDVAQVFSNLLFEGGDAVLPEIWDNLPARTRKNLEKALPEILETAQEKSILPAVQNVMMALHEWANSGIENFGEWKSQVDMFKGVKPDDIFTPFEMALGEKLANAKTQGEAKAIFQEYNELVSGTKETLFEQATEGKSMSDAVKELFNVELNEKDTQLQGERGVKATIPQEKPKTTTKTSKPQATGEGELTPDTPLKITSKEKALKAVDDLESFLLNLPGIKDNVGGERMGAPFSAEDAVKFFAEALREGVEQGYKVKEAIERAIGKLKEHKTYKALLDSVDESMLRDNARKNYEKQGVSLDKPIEQQFGASHASVAEVRKVMGLTDEINITDAHKRDTKTVMKEGKQIAESSNVQFLADDIISGEKIPNAQEQAALVYEQTKLYNESLDYQDRIDSFTEKGELNAADQATIELANIRARQRNVMDALDIAGTKMGLAFRMRQLINKRDYSLVALEKRWTSASGGNEITPSVRKQLEARVKELEAEVKKSEELFKAKDKELADQAMLDIQEALAREKTSPLQRIKAEKKARKQELAQKFRGVFNDATNIAKAMIDKEFYEYARLVLEEAAGDFKEFSKRMIGDLGKNVEPHLQEIFDKASKKEYEKAFVDEVKGIQIDKQIIRDIVEQGVKDSQELVDKVFDAVKDDLPEGTSRREVQDAISEYGKQINPKIDPLQAEINSLKRDLKLESGLEDATSGKGVKRSGFTQPKPTEREADSPKQRSLKRRINEELKNYPQDQAEVNKKWATALDRTKTALNNSITDLTKRLDDLKQGIATAKTPKERVKLDADAQALKDMRDDLVKQIEEIEGKKKLSYEQRVILAIEAAERTAQKYKNRTEEIKKTGTYSKDTPLQLSSPELDIARAKRDAAQAEFDQASKDANLDVIAATSKALRDSQDRVARLEQKVRSNDISYAQRAVRLAIETPELKASKAAEKALRDIIDTMREEQGVAELHRIELWKNRAANRLKELERRVRDKDYSKKVKKETPIDIEMERTAMKIDRAKFDLDVAIEVERYKNLQGWEKVGETVSDIFNIPKSIMASMDISAPFRQGAVLFARHPILGVKATKEMFKHLWSEKEANDWNDRLRLSDGYIRAKKSNLFISEPMARLVASEERFMSHMAEKIPVIGRGVKASNRAYSGFLNKIRTDVFNQHYEALVNEGFSGKELQSELSQMAHLINNFSGRGKLGKRGELASPLLNAAFFAPRYVTSRINTLANAVTGYWLEGRAYGSQRMSTRTRIEAYKALGAYVTVGVGVLQMAKAAGAEVEIDPRSSDFGKIKIGDLRYDIWAGFQQEIVLLARIFTQAKVDVFNGKVKKFNEGFGSSNTGSTVGNFLRSKASPQVGYALSAMTGTTMGMEEFDAGKELLRMSVPLLLQDPIANLIYNDAVSMYKEGDAGFGTFAAGATGIGVGYIPKPKPVEDANLKERSLNLMIGKQYKPQDYKDDEVYVKGKPYIISEDKMVKIKEMRAKEAGKLIEKNYWTLKKLTDEEYESKVNSYYNEGLKKARNKYLPSGWKNTK
jgi:hypothetical protein